MEQFFFAHIVIFLFGLIIIPQIYVITLDVATPNCYFIVNLINIVF